MPDALPLHGATFLRDLREHLEARGVSVERVIEIAGIKDPATLLNREQLPFSVIAKIFEAAARQTGDDLLGFRMGQIREMRRTGLICYVGLAAPTLRDFLQNVARYRRVFTDAIDIDVERLDSDGAFVWRYAVPEQVPRRQYAEFGASGLVLAIRQATNRRLSPRLVSFRHTRRTHLDAFDHYFGCETRFGAAQNVFHFRLEDLDLPLVTADVHLYSVLKDYCEQVLTSKTRNAPPLIVEVERAIADRLNSGRATQDCIAAAMGMSPRTLARRLAEEGTTYFKTLDHLRRALALSYLKDSKLALSEVTFLLGYSSLSSFSDAFKRWTGQTPGQFRRQEMT